MHQGGDRNPNRKGASRSYNGASRYLGRMTEDAPRIVRTPIPLAHVIAVADHAMTAPVPVHHPALAAGRWQTLPLMEQLGNVGSEVERAFRAHAQGRGDRFEHALARALELFDLTANDPRWRGHRYFLQFAVAARARNT